MQVRCDDHGRMYRYILACVLSVEEAVDGRRMGGEGEYKVQRSEGGREIERSGRRRVQRRRRAGRQAGKEQKREMRGRRPSAGVGHGSGHVSFRLFAVTAWPSTHHVPPRRAGRGSRPAAQHMCAHARSHVLTILWSVQTMVCARPRERGARSRVRTHPPTHPHAHTHTQHTHTGAPAHTQHTYTDPGGVPGVCAYRR